MGIIKNILWHFGYRKAHECPDAELDMLVKEYGIDFVKECVYRGLPISAEKGVCAKCLNILHNGFKARPPYCPYCGQKTVYGKKDGFYE